jgi:hypothetical protein
MVILILIIIFVFLLYLKFPIYENFFNDKRKGCFKSINRPLQCLYTYGNFIFPLDYRECSGICPEEVKKQEELYEGFESGKKPSYWCYTANDEGDDRKCIEKDVNISDPSKNNCGAEVATNAMKPVYDNEKQCKKHNFKCDSLSKTECGKIWGCGWCSDGNGGGKCVDGYSFGALNIKKKCWVSNGSSNNNFQPGHTNPFDILNPSPNV